MRKLILLTILLITRTILFAQTQEEKKEVIDPRPLNNINLSLVGDVSLISINYERQFIVNPVFILSSKIGLGYNEEMTMFCFSKPCSPPQKYLTIPHHITGNIGKGRHFFEFGLGGTMITGNTHQNYYLYPIVGYRLLPLNSKKVNFRIFAHFPPTQLLTEEESIMFAQCGLSVGISF